MIPISVRMTGWMRYRDEQVADFSQGRLIAICGENGAGKSSIFDAITFALYGQHRLGKQHAGDLISEDRDRLSVEFEFDADWNGATQRFVVRRSRGHKDGERDQSLWLVDDDGELAPVAGTDKEDGLRRAIEQIVRLSPEAFTSSFILQQGAATDFLDAEPRRRFEIVSSLIGLKEYEAIEKRAREWYRAEKARLDDIEQRLKEFEGVDAHALQAARDAAKAASRHDAGTARALQAAQVQMADAERYARLSSDRATLEEQIAIADASIARREQIEKDAETFAKLDHAVSTVEQIRAVLADASRAAAASADAQRRADGIDVDSLAQAHETSVRDNTQREADVHKREREHAQALEDERGAHDFAQIADDILRGRGRVAQCAESIATYESQLAALPDAERETDTVAAILGALPALRVFEEARAHAEEIAAHRPADAVKKLSLERKQAARQAGGIEKDIANADHALERARHLAAAASANVTSLDTQLGERRAAADESTCSRCGQPINKQHARAEIDELTRSLREARARAAQAAEAERAASAACDGARQRHKASGEKITAIEGQLAQAQARVLEQERAERVAAERRDAFEKVAPEPLALSAAAATDAAALVRIIAAHGDVPQRASAARANLDALHAVGGQRVQAIEERDRVAVALRALEARLDGRLKDVPNAQAAHAATKARLAAFAVDLRDARKTLDHARNAEKDASSALVAAREERAELLATAAQRSTEATGHRRSANAFASSLGDLAARAVEDPISTLDMLTSARTQLDGAPARKHELDRALRDHAGWSGRRQATDAEIASIPAAHRIGEADAHDVVAAARREADDARQASDTAQHALAVIEERIHHREALESRREVSSLRHKRLKKLETLLGKNGLQGVLVHDALTSITSEANGFLSRLTGGNLRLLLEHASGDALELQAIDATCMRTPRSVKALSGSQKFRCAVAVAAGIGRYAGAGGMRSIVIDEGFGSLDSAGQETMVDELKNLATHMERVIVVSHLEMFTNPDNFPEQIVVETAGATSRIRRRC